MAKSSAAVTAFQKQLAAAGIATSRTPVTPKQMEKAAVRYQRDQLASIERVQKRVASGATLAGNAQAAASTKAAAAAKAWVLHTAEGDKIIAGTEKHAKALARAGDSFYELTSGAGKFVALSKDGVRQLIDNENHAKELQRRLGVTYRPLNVGAEHARVANEQVAASLRQTSSQTKAGAVQMRNFADQTRLVGEDLKRAKLPEHGLQLGRVSRGALAGAGAFTSLGRSIAYASASFLAFAVLSGVFRSAVAAAAQFHESLARIVGLAGGVRKNVDEMGKSILRLGPQVGVGPRKLADALYFIASAGIAASKQMGVLKVSAQASAAGLGETEVVADAVTSAMNAYGQGNLSAAKATNVLVDTVRYGKGEAAAFAPVIGTVASFAAALGVKFSEVGASLAEMTRLGIPAYTAAIQLQAVFSNILHPTIAADKALGDLAKKAGVGVTSFKDLISQLREHGLLSVLETLKKVFKGNDAAMAQVFTNVRALRGVLSLVGKSASDTFMIFRRMAGSTRALAVAFGAISKDPAQRFRAFQATVESLEIAIGSALLPTVVKIGDAMGKWLSKPGNIEKLNKGVQDVMHTIGLLLKTVWALLEPIRLLAKAGASLTGGWSNFFKVLIAGWAFLHVKQKFFANEMGKIEKQKAVQSAKDWIDSYKMRNQAAMQSVRRNVVQRRDEGLAEATPVRVVRQPGGRGQMFMGDRQLSREDIFEPSPGRFTARGAGGQMMRVKFVEDQNFIRRQVKATSQAVKSSFTAINQATMQAQRDLFRRAPGIGGILNSLFGTPTQQQNELGRFTTQLRRQSRTTLSGVVGGLNQSLLQAQQRIGRQRPAIGGLMNALFGTPTRQQNELGRFTTQLQRQGRTTLTQVFRNLSQASMRAQQQLGRARPGAGGFLNTLIGTPTRQQNQLGQFTSQLRRQGNAWLSLSNSIRGGSENIKSFFSTLERNQTAFRTPVRAIFGVPTRQRNELGQFTNEVVRQGGAVNALAGQWQRAISRIGGALRGLRGADVGGGFRPPMEGPFRSFARNVSGLMRGSAASMATAFRTGFAVIGVNARIAASAMALSFKVALIRIAVLMKAVFSTVAFGFLVVAATELVFHLKDIAHWLGIIGNQNLDQMKSAFDGINVSMEKTVELQKTLKDQNESLIGRRQTLGDAVNAVRQARARHDAAPKGSLEAKGAAIQVTAALLAERQAEEDLDNAEAARRKTLEGLTQAENERAQNAASVGKKLRAAIEDLRRPSGAAPGLSASELKRQIPPSELRKAAEEFPGKLTDNLEDLARSGSDVQKTAAGALASISAIYGKITDKQINIAIKLALQGESSNNIFKKLFGEKISERKSPETIRFLAKAHRFDEFGAPGAFIPAALKRTLPFHPGDDSSKFAIPPTAEIHGATGLKGAGELQLAEAQASGNVKAQLRVTKAIITWIQAVRKTGQLTTQQQIDAANALTGYKAQVKSLQQKQFAVPLKLQLKEAEAAVSGSKKQEIAIARQIKNYIQGIVDAGKGGLQFLINANQALAQYKAQIKELDKASFEVPIGLQKDEAKAAAYGSAKKIEAAQKVVARAILNWVDKQIASGKLADDALIAAYQLRANERSILEGKETSAAKEHAGLLKTAAGLITDAVDAARSAIGDLFQGPILNPSDRQNKMTLGLSGPAVSTLTKDVNAQVNQYIEFQNALAKLGKKGVPKSTIDELSKLGVSALPEVQALLKSTPAQLKAFIAAATRREKEAQKVALVQLRSNKVDLFAQSIVVKLTNKQLKSFTETGVLSAEPKGQKPGTGLVAHALGGVVAGHGHGDTVPAMLTPGEVVFNAKQQAGLKRQLGVTGGPRALFEHVKRFAQGGVATPDMSGGHFAGGGVATPKQLRDAGVAKFGDLTKDEQRRRVLFGLAAGRMSFESAKKAFKFWNLHTPPVKDYFSPYLQQDSGARDSTHFFQPGRKTDRTRIPISADDILKFNLIGAPKGVQRDVKAWYNKHAKGAFHRQMTGISWLSLFIPGKAGISKNFPQFEPRTPLKGQDPNVGGHPVLTESLRAGKSVLHENKWRAIGRVERTAKGIMIIPESGKPFTIPWSKPWSRVRDLPQDAGSLLGGLPYRREFAKDIKVGEKVWHKDWVSVNKVKVTPRGVRVNDEFTIPKDQSVRVNRGRAAAARVSIAPPEAYVAKALAQFRGGENTPAQIRKSIAYWDKISDYIVGALSRARGGGLSGRPRRGFATLSKNLLRMEKKVDARVLALQKKLPEAQALASTRSDDAMHLSRVGKVKSTIDDMDSHIVGLGKIKGLVQFGGLRGSQGKPLTPRMAAELRGRINQVRKQFSFKFYGDTVPFENLRDHMSGSDAARYVDNVRMAWIGARNQYLKERFRPWNKKEQQLAAKAKSGQRLSPEEQEALKKLPLSPAEQDQLAKLYKAAGKGYPQRMMGGRVPYKKQAGGENVSDPERGQGGRRDTPGAKLKKKLAREKPIITEEFRTLGDGDVLWSGWKNLKRGDRVVNYTDGKIVAHGEVKGINLADKFASVYWDHEGIARVNEPWRILRREEGPYGPKDVAAPKVGPSKPATRLVSQQMEARSVRPGDQVFHDGAWRAVQTSAMYGRNRWRIKPKGEKAFTSIPTARLKIRRAEALPAKPVLKYAWQLKEGWKFRKKATEFEQASEWAKIWRVSRIKDASGKVAKIMVQTNPDKPSQKQFFEPQFKLETLKMAMGGVVPFIGRMMAGGGAAFHHDRREPSMYMLPGKWPGLLKRGNINLLNRPSLKNPFVGGMSSVWSTSFQDRFGREVLVPQVIKGAPGARKQKDRRDHFAVGKAAWANYLKTGRELGIFDSVPHANLYAKALHMQQAKMAGGGIATGFGMGDTVPALLTPGEVVFNRKHQMMLKRALGVQGNAGALFDHVDRASKGVKMFADGGVSDGWRAANLASATPGPKSGTLDQTGSRIGDVDLGEKAGSMQMKANQVRLLAKTVSLNTPAGQLKFLSTPATVEVNVFINGEKQTRVKQSVRQRRGGSKPSDGWMNSAGR